jgi:hypothetical protein
MRTFVTIFVQLAKRTAAKTEVQNLGNYGVFVYSNNNKITNRKHEVGRTNLAKHPTEIR